MRKLPKPVDDVRDVFRDCISTMQSPLKTRLEACKDEIVYASQEFDAKVETNLTHTIKATDMVAGIVSKDEMTKVYKNKMAKKGEPGRKYYDKYLASPKNGICPLCGQRTASTLDHYLPKMKYPTLAVTPTNLVPACKDCNKDKGEKEFTDSSEETIHPYFDDIENETWLYAIIIEEDELAIIFDVKKPNNWTDTMYKRVKNHFKMFNLNALYSAHSAEEISNILGVLLNVYKKAGSTGLNEMLRDFYESSERVHLNSWKTAMYKALYESHWFCNEWIAKKYGV